MSTQTAHQKPAKKIGVVCAPSPGINPGMVSVDLAFHAVCRRNGYENVEYFQLFDPSEYSQFFPGIDDEKIQYCNKNPIIYQRLIGNQDRLLSCDAIIFWGDWTHAAVYCRKIVIPSLVMLGICPDEKNAELLINRYLFLDGQPNKIFHKTISFGETLIFNSLWDEHFSYHELDIKKFFKKINNVYMRDVFSATKIRRIRSDYSKSFLGVDCAMLLTKEDNLWLPGKLSRTSLKEQEGKIAVYFGRSNIQEKTASEIVSNICNLIGAEAFWLPWGSSFAFPKSKSALFSLPAGATIEKLQIGDQFNLIQSAKAVITDTYHICVNAWRMGVPAICIGGSLATSDMDVNSGRMFASNDKRYALFSMIEALDFFIHESELDNPEHLSPHLAHIADVLTNEKLVNEIAFGIRSAANAAEKTLVDNINSLLQSTPSIESMRNLSLTNS